jgi:hypothetical protein
VRADKKMAAPRASQKSIGAHPVAADTGAPSGRSDKIAAPITAWKAVVSSPAAVDVGSSSEKIHESRNAPKAAPWADKTLSTAVAFGAPPVEVCKKLAALWPPCGQARCPWRGRSQVPPVEVCKKLKVAQQDLGGAIEVPLALVATQGAQINYAACPRPCCMFMFMLHVHVNAAYPCP